MNKVVALKPEVQHSLNPAQLDLVKRTVAKDCTSVEFDMFMAVCKRVGLDPFRRQIHCVIYNKDKPAKRQMVLITSIDGLRAVAARAGDYRPDENPADITFDKSSKDAKVNPSGIVRAVVRPWKLGADGEWHQLSGEAYWDEFAPIEEKIKWIDTGEVWEDTGKPKKSPEPTGEFFLDPKNSFWRKMPTLMLAKCAEAQALRKGWPEDLSGIYTEDEMKQAESKSASEELEDYAVQERIRKIGGANNIVVQWRAGEALEHVPIGSFMDRSIEFIKKCTSATEIDTWKNLNKHSLQEFWALSAGDALELKRIIEQATAKLDSIQ